MPPAPQTAPPGRSVTSEAESLVRNAAESACCPEMEAVGGGGGNCSLTGTGGRASGADCTRVDLERGEFAWCLGFARCRAGLTMIGGISVAVCADAGFGMMLVRSATGESAVEAMRIVRQKPVQEDILISMFDDEATGPHVESFRGCGRIAEGRSWARGMPPLEQRTSTARSTRHQTKEGGPLAHARSGVLPTHCVSVEATRTIFAAC